MKSSTVVLIIGVVVVFLVLAAPSWGQDIGQNVKLSWKQVRSDIHGNRIPKDVVEYRIYTSEEGGEVEFVAQVTGKSYFVWQPVGCYTAEVTTLRTDLALESDMSNMEAYCVDPITVSGKGRGKSAGKGNNPHSPVPAPTDISVEKLYE